MRGFVKRFNDYNGWGFITGDDGKDYFVHQNDFHHLVDTLRVGERVEFQPHRSRGRGPSAHAVKTVSDEVENTATGQPSTTIPSEDQTLSSTPSESAAVETPRTELAASIFSRDFLQDPEYFVGRESQFKRAYRSILASQDVLIFGSRGVGKSSFAEMLYQALTGGTHLREAYELPPPSGPVLAVKHMCGAGDDLTKVAREIAKKITTKLSAGENFRLLVGSARRWVQDLIVSLNFKDSSDNVLKPGAFAEIISARLRTDHYNHVAIFIDELENMVFERPDDAVVPIAQQRIQAPERNIASFAREVRQALPERQRAISFIFSGPNQVVDHLKEQSPGWYQRVDPFALPNLSQSESKIAISRRLGTLNVQATDDALDLLATACGGIPLVLIQAAELAAAAAKGGVVDLVCCRSALEEFAQIQRSKSFSSSLLNASNLERKVFLAIASIDQEWFSANEIGEIIGESYQKCTPVLSRLTQDLHLAHDSSSQKYSLYDGIGKVYMRIVQQAWRDQAS
jgi:cold shock CspA family protein